MKMRVTTNDIRKWLKRGDRKGSRYMIVETDTFSYEYYPVFVDSHEDLEKRKRSIRNKSMTSIREIYDLNKDWDDQLNSTHAWV